MAMTLITTNTSDGAAASSFTTGIDATYRTYLFRFYDVNPATDAQAFQVQFNATGQSDYNETQTTTFITAQHGEDGSGGAFAYDSGQDVEGTTTYQNLTVSLGNGADESAAGELWLFFPSSSARWTTYLATVSEYHSADKLYNNYVSGIIQVAAAITDVSFKMASGDMDAVISLYGIN